MSDKLPDSLEALLEQDRSYLAGFVDTAEAARITGVPAASLTTLRSRGGGPVFFQPPGTRIVRYLRLHLYQWMTAGGLKMSTEDPGTAVHLPEAPPR